MGGVKSTSQGVTISSRGGNPSKPQLWRPSALQREYRTVLNLAKEARQVIVDTDDELLVIERKEESDFRRGLQERVSQVARLKSVLAAHHGYAPREWAAQTDFPYLAAFQSDDVDEFFRELLAYTLDASQRGTLENLEGNLRAWESSASIYENPEALAMMTADIDLAQMVEVFPPSDEQVRAAEEPEGG